MDANNERNSQVLDHQILDPETSAKSNLNSLPAGYFQSFCCLIFMIFFKINLFWKILSGIQSECQTVWIQSTIIRPNILLGLIWVLTVCIDYQQTTLVGKELYFATLILPVFFLPWKSYPLIAKCASVNLDKFKYAPESTLEANTMDSVLVQIGCNWGYGYTLVHVDERADNNCHKLQDKC